VRRRLTITIVIACAAFCYGSAVLALTVRFCFGGRVLFDFPAPATTVVDVREGLSVRLVGFSPDVDGDYLSAAVVWLLSASLPPLVWGYVRLGRGDGLAAAASDGRTCRRVLAVLGTLTPVAAVATLMGMDPEGARLLPASRHRRRQPARVAPARGRPLPVRSRAPPRRRPLPDVRLRPPRHARPVPGMR
jgi:hypothetical protein